jgi:hypothetical protein
VTDLRPALSAKLKILSEGPQWFTWPGFGNETLQRLRLEAVPEQAAFDPPGVLAIIVSRSKFGLARVVYKDGLWAHDVRWLHGGGVGSLPISASLRIHRPDVRAVATESRDRASPETPS